MHAGRLERERDDPVISLVFPTYNPGPRLQQTWETVQRFLRQAPGRLGDWEVIFVCDGCTDGSPARLQQWARATGRPSPGRTRVVSYRPNRGKGYAVRRGLAEARGQWRLFTDVDLAYGLEEVERVAEALRGGAEVAIASRLHPDSRLVLPSALQGYAYRRHLQSMVFSALARLVLPLAQQDTQAGLKGMSARVARLVLPHLRCDGFGFDCELLTACCRFGIPVVEVPVHVRFEERASTTGVGSMVRMVRELWRIRRTWQAPPDPALPVEPSRNEAA